ncbi:tyrosine-protein kinase family protein [Arthrobacter sp. Sa2CUA1]|uniref:Tyrosine-protein kinase family protein n=1 Tax=Arthrobacter gallicola TaxID=2762225 RepID=A0ABR8US50_9MICC|nr:tyrosine-protein kinase family protein [Arthrobacter gallicola]MBD7995381.1 tyrosine-protein kinase family protein [Arthrobacter gallicola]
MSTIPIVTSGTGTAALVQGLERLQGPVTVIRRCGELTELIAACQSGMARAAIVDDDAGELTASLAERLAAAGVALVVLADDDETKARLETLGIQHAPRSLESTELAALVAEAVAGHQERFAARGSASSLADPAETLRRWELAGRETEPAEPLPESRGTLVAVWGPAGAPGRTTLAVNLAAEAAAAGSRVLLIDADTYAPSIAAGLGLTEESAGVAQACRLADQGLLDPVSLTGSGVSVEIKGQRMTVLTGITRSDRWLEIRGTALGRVLEQSRGVADITVVDCGFSVEADEELSFDTMAPRRNAATLTALEHADTVYAVGAADPVGVPRLVRALAELETAVPGVSPLVVLNKVRRSAAGRSPERQLSQAWERFGPGKIDAFLPADWDAADAALLAGAALLEAAPASPLRSAIAALANVPAGSRRGSRRRWRAGAK